MDIPRREIPSPCRLHHGLHPGGESRGPPSRKDGWRRVCAPPTLARHTTSGSLCSRSLRCAVPRENPHEIRRKGAAEGRRSQRKRQHRRRQRRRGQLPEWGAGQECAAGSDVSGGRSARKLDLLKNAARRHKSLRPDETSDSARVLAGALCSSFHPPFYPPTS